MLKFIETYVKQKYKGWPAYEKAANLPKNHGKRRAAFYLAKLSALLKPLGLTLKIEEIQTMKIFITAFKNANGQITAFYFLVETKQGEFKSSILEEALNQSNLIVEDSIISAINSFANIHNTALTQELLKHDVLLYDSNIGLTLKIEEDEK